MKRILILVLASMLFACGPNISVTRMAYFPPRSESCDLAVVNHALATPESFALPDSEYEIVGTIGISESANEDPFSDRYMAIVRPRACGMGGEAVSLMASQTSNAYITNASGTAYVVLRRRDREASHAASAPHDPSAI